MFIAGQTREDSLGHDSQKGKPEQNDPKGTSKKGQEDDGM
jgi:hypothetical protein